MILNLVVIVVGVVVGVVVVDFVDVFLWIRAIGQLLAGAKVAG